MLIRFIHHLLQPHCPECQRERDEANNCESCETLREQLAAERSYNRLLLESIILKPEVERTEDTSNLTPIRGNFVSSRVRREMLEAEDRKQAEIINERKRIDKEARELATKTTEELERELGIEHEEAAS